MFGKTVKNGLKRFLVDRSLPARHWIARNLLAPKLYEDAVVNFPASMPTGVPRPMILFCRERFRGDPVNGLEIGVAGGLNAESILQLLNMQILFLVDPYVPYLQKANYRDPAVRDYSEFFEQAKDRLDPQRVVFVRYSSMRALKFIPDGLDLCYIDGNHGYENVQADIALYYHKVRSGGVIGGHDFDGNYTGVCLAVIEFVKKHDLELYSEKSDWWVVKP